MRLGWLFLFLSLAVSASAQFKLYEQGIDAYQGKHYLKAISHLNEYLDKGTRDKALDVEVHYVLALSYFKTQSFTSSVREFDRALELGHQNKGNIHWFMAKGYGQLRAFKESVEEFDQALQNIKEPADQSKIYFDRGLQYFNQNQNQLAHDDVTKAIALNKINEEAKSLLAKLDDLMIPVGGSRDMEKKGVEPVANAKGKLKDKKDVKSNAASILEKQKEQKILDEKRAEDERQQKIAQAKIEEIKEKERLQKKADEETKIAAAKTVEEKKRLQKIADDKSAEEEKQRILDAKAVEEKKRLQQIADNKKELEDKRLKEIEDKKQIVASSVPAIPVLEEKPLTLAEIYKSEKRYALVIGNSKYKAVAPLKNATNDANDIAAELEKSNFEVIKVLDGDYIKMREAFTKFHQKLTNGPKDQTIGLFYYAGHGLQNEGENYLVPIEADVKYDDDIPRMCLPMQRVVLANMERSSTRMNIVIMDACRNNPFPSSARDIGGGGLAEIKRAKGSFIAYATSPGATASDGEGRNGLYTQELLKAMKKPGRTIEQVFKEVRQNVLKLSEDKQNTWDSSNIIGEFYFKF
ncbi:MAG: caspase family protein [Cyclobacteriaceae bacterium]